MKKNTKKIPIENDQNDKKRKKTRKKVAGTKVPSFVINGEEYLSLYDVRNFLDESENGQSLKYELRKKYQNLERNNPTGKLVVEQKEIMKLMDEKYKVHINPNKKNVFIKLDLIYNDRDFKYLKDKHKIEIDEELRIVLDDIPVIEGAKEVVSPNKYKRGSAPKKQKLEEKDKEIKKTTTKKKTPAKKKTPEPKKRNTKSPNIDSQPIPYQQVDNSMQNQSLIENSANILIDFTERYKEIQNKGIMVSISNIAPTFDNSVPPLNENIVENQQQFPYEIPSDFELPQSSFLKNDIFIGEIFENEINFQSTHFEDYHPMNENNNDPIFNEHFSDELLDSDVPEQLFQF